MLIFISLDSSWEYPRGPVITGRLVQAALWGNQKGLATQQQVTSYREDIIDCEWKSRHIISTLALKQLRGMISSYHPTSWAPSLTLKPSLHIFLEATTDV